MIVVQKFGGTSLATEENRNKVVKKVVSEYQKGSKVIVVVSAMGRKPDAYSTDALLDLIRNIDIGVSKREMDFMASCGEAISAAIISAKINKLGFRSVALNGMQAGIITDNDFTKAKVKFVDNKRITKLLDEGIIPIVTGFQGITEDGEITTLGRGGSDTTASIIGEAVSADIIEIYTDVNGIMTADPKVCKNAKTINYMQYDELFQMAESGAKVIHKDAAYIAKRAKIKLKIKSTFSDEEGTNISDEIKGYKDNTITGVATEAGKVMINLSYDGKNMVNIFDDIRGRKIKLYMLGIINNDVAFCISEDDLKVLEDILNLYKMSFKKIESCVRVTIIGRFNAEDDMTSIIYKLMEKNNIKTLAAKDSNVAVSIIIDKSDLEKAVNLIHENFKL